MGCKRNATYSILFSTLFPSLIVGCATTPMETHREGMQSLTEQEYFIPKKPVDRHYIGCAWSKQFGPVEDSASSDIRIKMDRSFDAMQQHFAYSAGISLGGESISGPGGGSAELRAEGGKSRGAQLEDVQIISPVSLADIPFEPGIPYVTEALRLRNFVLKSEAAAKAEVGAGVSPYRAGIMGGAEGGAATAGEGLVVAYKLHMINAKSYTKQDSGSIPLELDKTLNFQNGNVFVRSSLEAIEPGSKQTLSRDLLWACDRAHAKSRDMVAAWIVDIRPKDPRLKSLQIAFPAFPRIGDCQNFSGVIYSRIDPLTDKIIRQKMNIFIIQGELSDSLRPQRWEAQVSLVEESFNITLVKQDDLEKVAPKSQ